jgi:hypothetical protein
MKTNLLSLIAFSILLIAVSCSNPSTNTPTIAVDDSKLVETTRGAGADDLNLLFARKWLGENTFLDLKIDNTFTASLDGQNELFGDWFISEDQSTLTLSSEKSIEGKGKGFLFKYTIVKVTSDAMIVKDTDGNEITFASN